MADTPGEDRKPVRLRILQVGDREDGIVRALLVQFPDRESLKRAIQTERLDAELTWEGEVEIA